MSRVHSHDITRTNLKRQNARVFAAGAKRGAPLSADSLEGVAQQEADLAAVVALFAFALVALGPVKLRFDLPDAGHLLLLLAVEVRTGELVSHGLGPARTR